jgi:hypothetical protein
MTGRALNIVGKISRHGNDSIRVFIIGLTFYLRKREVLCRTICLLSCNTKRTAKKTKLLEGMQTHMQQGDHIFLPIMIRGDRERERDRQTA